jgi:hypothetical protein
MKFETRFPKGFPEVGDVIRFTCMATTNVSVGSVTASQIEGRKIRSTVEAMVIARCFDEGTGLHYLTTSDDSHKHICNIDGWESDGFIRG